MMKGVILAGGTGSRLYPLTKVTNKPLLPVGKKPMILHPVEKLTQAGVTDILVVTGVDHMGDVVNLLGSGKDFSCKFTYKVQDEAGGIAQALGLAEGFCAGSPMVVLLGDNIFTDSLKQFCEQFYEQRAGAKVLLKEVPDPQRFGVAEISGDRIVNIEEKPKFPKSSLVVTGIYFYDPEVFSVIRTLKPSVRGELEVSDINNAYIRRGQMTYDLLRGPWTDAGTFESLWHANSVMLGERDGSL
jgi:glucose-1-phosphate thymidylyltransferase